MSYLALYRKYRPRTFDEVYGQQAIVQTLRSQVITNRIAHAYLFSGPRGTGKTSIAKIFSMAINCQNPVNGSPCLQCESCKRTLDGLNIDITEIDAASNNGVDNIRDLIEESKYVPQYGKRKVYIIDEVHMLSQSAFNALLKTLEEPPKTVTFILATTEEYKVPKTIYSRCQRYNFKLISENVIVDALKDILYKEHVKYELPAIEHISKLAKGGLRDALSLLDQVLAYNKEISYNDVQTVFGEVQDATIAHLADCITKRNVHELLDAAKQLRDEGKNMYSICMDLYEYYKEMYFHSSGIDGEIAQRNMRILAELSEQMKYNSNYVTFEINMIKLCKPQMEKDYSSLIQRIQILEDTVEQLTNGKSIAFNAPERYNETDVISFYVQNKRLIQYECEC